MNWRDLFGRPTLVEFPYGTFGVRRRILPLLPTYTYLDFHTGLWWRKSSPHFKDCQAPRSAAEQAIIERYKRRLSDKVIDTNPKVLIAEHMLMEQAQRGEKPQADWGSILANKIWQTVAVTPPDAKFAAMEADLKRYQAQMDVYAKKIRDGITCKTFKRVELKDLP